MGDHADDLMEWMEDERDTSILIQQNRAKDKRIAELEADRAHQIELRQGLLAKNQELTAEIAELEAEKTEWLRSTIEVRAMVAKLEHDYHESKAELARLTEANRWIPVEERLPEDWQEVLAEFQRKDGPDADDFVYVAWIDPDLKDWDSDRMGDEWVVVRWREKPLPEGPES